ncbi:MAG: peptide deformylase [Acidimicrobiia bacterium]
MAPYDIRLFGDPVLTLRSAEVAEIDGSLASLADEMVLTMREAPGLGLAAPQVGVRKRLFVYELRDEEGPKVIVNPTITEAEGEWPYDEGCLSVPGLSWEIVRPKTVLLSGRDLDGNEVEIEADELVARLFQHELDHLDGVLLFDRMETDQRKLALKTVRGIVLNGGLRRPERASTDREHRL